MTSVILCTPCRLSTGFLSVYFIWLLYLSARKVISADMLQTRSRAGTRPALVLVLHPILFRLRILRRSLLHTARNERLSLPQRCDGECHYAPPVPDDLFSLGSQGNLGGHVAHSRLGRGRRRGVAPEVHLLVGFFASAGQGRSRHW